MMYTRRLTFLSALGYKSQLHHLETRWVGEVQTFQTRNWHYEKLSIKRLDRAATVQLVQRTLLVTADTG